MAAKLDCKLIICLLTIMLAQKSGRAIRTNTEPKTVRKIIRG